MDYEVGSIADLISGNHTPNRRKVTKKPLTPVKVPPSSNVTPSIPENVKSRTPKLAFTPETTTKSSSKNRIPTNDQFESPKSVPKKTKSKLFNNFQFLSQLPDHPESDNEESAGDEENEGFSEKKKAKKYNKEDAKKIVKEYYVGKEELNTGDAKSKKEKKKSKKDSNKEHSNDEEISVKQKKTSSIYDEIDEDKQDKKSKKKKRKNRDLNEEITDDTSADNLRKKKKRKSESDFSADNDDGLKNSDDDLPISENEMNLQEAENDAADSEEDDVPKSDFQKAAARRVEKKLLKEEKFSVEETERTLFVGNIPVSVLQKNHEKVLRNKFSPYGGIESVRIRNIPLADFKIKPKVALIEKKFHAERTTVIAYIKFRNAASVGKALVENNSLLEGNHLRVDRCYVDRKVQVDSRKTVFLGNLPFNIEEETLRALFKNCGTILSIRVVRDRQTQIGKGIGFINFEKSDGVELAMSLSEEDLKIKNKTIRVQRYATGGKKKDFPNKRNDPRDNNRVVGKRYQKFHQPMNNEPQKPFNRKRDEQGNKKRKRNVDGSYNKNPKWSAENEREENQNDHSAGKKFKKNSESNEISQQEPSEGSGPAKITEGSSQQTTEIAPEVTKQSRKERGIEFKGLIAKKKKKLKLNKAVLKKKKISKILLHEVKKSQ